jgi:hypothetical protein
MPQKRSPKRAKTAANVKRIDWAAVRVIMPQIMREQDCTGGDRICDSP